MGKRMLSDEPRVWFPAVQVGTGVDVFTRQLCAGLNAMGIQAEIDWLPARAEYLPWSVKVPEPPAWANIVHVNTWLHRRFVPSRLKVVATMHLCVHDPAYRPHKSLAQALYHRSWVRSLEAWILQRADAVVAVSKYTADRTRAEFGAQGIQTIVNGVPLPRKDPGHGKRKPHTPFRFLYVGNWSMRKGVDLLGPIMEQLGSEFELRYTADVNGGHAKAELPSNCICLGRLSQAELQRAYQNADALLFPSRLEGLPLSVLESMAAGLPAIVSDASSLPEVVTHEHDGLICPSENVEAYVNAARRLASNESELRRLGTQALRTVEERFSIDAMTRAYAEVYRRLLARA